MKTCDDKSEGKRLFIVLKPVGLSLEVHYQWLEEEWG